MPAVVIDPNLLAGWEPHAPVADSLLRRFLANWTAAIEAHGIALGGRTLRRDDLTAVDVGRPTVGANVTTLLAPLDAEHAAEVMAALDEFYRFTSGECSGTVYLFSPWPTPDLRPHGWTLSDYPPLMLRPVGGDTPPIPPCGLQIERVRNHAGLQAFAAAIVRGFTMPEIEAQGPENAFSPSMLSDERRHLWVGWEGDQPVCAAASFVEAGVNNVDLVATVPEARRRGFGAALAWRATFAAPHLPSLLISTEEGRPLYEQIGYLTLFRLSLWSQERSQA
jgi:GNAT superfamily N-acetyltransferase